MACRGESGVLWTGNIEVVCLFASDFDRFCVVVSVASIVRRRLENFPDAGFVESAEIFCAFLAAI